MTWADIVGICLALPLLPVAVGYGMLTGGARGAVTLSIGVAAHLVVAIGSVAGWFLPPAEDTLAFHNRAIDLVQGLRSLSVAGPSSEFWSYALSYVYAPLGPSIWLGYVINQWIFLAALVQLAKFGSEMGAGRNRWTAVLAFSLAPSSLLFCNFLLREPFQVFSLIFAIRRLEQYRRGGSTKTLVTATAALVPFGAIHNGFFLFAPIALIVSVFARSVLSSNRRQSLGRSLAVILLGAALAATAIAFVGSFEGNRRIVEVREGTVDLDVALQNVSADGARTVLPWTSGRGLGEIALNAPMLLIQFMFAPVLPFMVRASQDLIAALDTLLRIAALVLTSIVYLRSDRPTRRSIIYLGCLYLSFCFVAALGSFTVGAAMRHHMKIFWISMTIGVMALSARPKASLQRAYVPTNRPGLRHRP
jgi:hypothetical protein